jgi:hypothetical protein
MNCGFTTADVLTYLCSITNRLDIDLETGVPGRRWSTAMFLGCVKRVVGYNWCFAATATKR